ncbi:hypothetical protein Ddye_028043 [Dipteronia dyeriana]|uniref:Cytochrome P450 n=1 Tax=Dipteronia dyeriana TaxID=168575 RepID=A0AAD9WS05_9ROSI|nr:hypothetical protein Ddye_028043 [Dipteronia dyeriana]
MELEFSSCSCLLSSLLFLFLVLNIINKRSKNNGKPTHLPPGPRKLPIIGNLHNLATSSDLPHRQLRRLAGKYGPLMHLQLGELSTVVVSSAEFAKEVMKTHDLIFASRPYNLAIDIMSYNFTDIAFSPYGEYWRQLRKICVLELLSMKRVQSFRSIREEEGSNLINWIASRAGSSINLTHKIYSLSYIVVSRTAFGKECKDQELFLSILEGSSKLAGGFSIADVFPSIEGLLHWFGGIKSQLEKMHREADQIVENIINDHKMRKTATSELGKNVKNHEDLVDVLLKVQEDGDGEFRLTTDNMKAVIWDVFGAGGEASATTIDWALSELMKNPTVMTKVQAEVREVFNRNKKVDETEICEMKFLKLVIKETLRLHPPGPLLAPRVCGEKCEIKGFDIPNKTRVFVNAWAIGRDPEYWNDPESFIPERFLDSHIDYKGSDFEYIPFGTGRRICPGMSFGLANVELPLSMLLYHFDWKLPDGIKHEDLNMTETFGIVVRRQENLYLVPHRYCPSFAA